MKYLHLFQTQQEHDAAYQRGEGGEYKDPWVAYTEETKNVSYNLPHDYSLDYFTTTALEDGTITFAKERVKNYGSYATLSTTQFARMSYSIDNGDSWVTLTNNGENATQTLSVNVQSGQSVIWKGVATSFTTYVGPQQKCCVSFSSSTCNFDVSGNIASLYSEDSFEDAICIGGGRQFAEFFNYNDKLISAKNLILPSDGKDFERMFAYCTSLTTSPALPATTLAQSCYVEMFEGCTSLTTAPELPATTLANRCYAYMFSGCTSLTKSPELPATTLARGCYEGMFSNTSALPDTSNIDFASQTVVDSGGLIGLFRGTIVTDSDLERILPKNAQNKYCLPATTLAEDCYNGMFSGCRSLTTAPVLPATTLSESCYFDMFSGCTSLTAAPALPATTLVYGCYTQMFGGCTSLNYIKMLATDVSANNCLSQWVSGVASTGTFVKNSAATWNVTGASGIPNGWTVETASA